MSNPAAATEEDSRAAAASSTERALRRKFAADKVAQIPIVEHALDLYAHGGPDMRAEAEAVEALLADFSERMRRPR